MSNTPTAEEFLRALPPVLRNDSRMIALGQVVAEELSDRMSEIEKAAIYPRIDEKQRKTAIGRGVFITDFVLKAHVFEELKVDFEEFNWCPLNSNFRFRNDCSGNKTHNLDWVFGW